MKTHLGPALLLAVLVVLATARDVTARERTRHRATEFAASLALRVVVVDAGGDRDGVCVAGNTREVGRTGGLLGSKVDVPGSRIWFVEPVDKEIGDDEVVALAAVLESQKAPGLSLHGCSRVTDAVTPVLAELERLEYLDIRGTAIRARDTKALAGMKRLRWADFWEAPVESLAWVEGASSLEVLRVGRKGLPTSELVHLEKAPKLRALHISAPRGFSDESLKPLRALGGLRTLEISNILALGNAGVAHLGGLTELEHLDLNGCSISDAGLEHLSQLTNLRSLVLRDCQDLRGKALARLAKLPKLRRLDLGGTSVRGKSLSALLKFPALEVLDLRRARGVGNSGLKALAGHPTLAELDLGRTPVDDGGIHLLLELPELYRVELDGSRVSARGAAALRAKMPDCEIVR